MFTGIIEEIGKVVSVKKNNTGAKLTIRANKVTKDISLGGSVAVNGVCLTVTKKESNFIVADVMNETLKNSTLQKLAASDYVNLERAIRPDSRFGGHIVTGHIDGVGIIENILKDGIGIWYKIKTNSNLLKYIVKKGSVCINGVSLTIADVYECGFKVCIIPHTYNKTALFYLCIKSIVNIETDIIGKYAEKFLTGKSKNFTHNLTLEKLKQAGF